MIHVFWRWLWPPIQFIFKNRFRSPLMAYFRTEHHERFALTLDFGFFPRMDPWSPPGTLVVFAFPESGTVDDVECAAHQLTPGTTYMACGTEVLCNTTRVYIFTNKSFNCAQFATEEDLEHAAWESLMRNAALGDGQIAEFMHRRIVEHKPLFDFHGRKLTEAA